jgi:hypothetical protein
MRLCVTPAPADSGLPFATQAHLTPHTPSSPGLVPAGGLPECELAIPHKKLLKDTGLHVARLSLGTPPAVLPLLHMPSPPLWTSSISPCYRHLCKCLEAAELVAIRHPPPRAIPPLMLAEICPPRHPQSPRPPVLSSSFWLLQHFLQPAPQALATFVRSQASAVLGNGPLQWTPQTPP